MQDKQFNLIISNPLYIKQDNPCLKDLIYEPQTGLISGKDGLDDIRIIIKQTPQYLISNTISDKQWILTIRTMDTIRK